MVRLPKLPQRRSRPVPALFFPDRNDDEAAARCGFIFTTDPDARPMRLAEPLASMRADRVRVSPGDLVAGQCYLIGTPGRLDVEVVRVYPGEPGPRQAWRIMRSQFRTVATIHPAGTPVTAVTIRYVADWAQEDASEGPGR
jgi:hypothetical protein